MWSVDGVVMVYQCWCPHWEGLCGGNAGEGPCIWEVHTREFEADRASCKKKTREGNGINVVKC